MAEQDITSKLEAMNCISELVRQRDDLLAALKGALEGMNKPAVQATGEWQTGLFCGLEDRGIKDRYEACMYGYEQALEKVQEWVLCDFEAAIAKAQSNTSVQPISSSSEQER